MTYYDAHIPESYFDYGSDFVNAYCTWLETHGVDVRSTHRVEHLVIDAPLIRVFQVARNEDGKVYADPATGDLAYRKPFDVLVRTEAPRPEDYR